MLASHRDYLIRSERLLPGEYHCSQTYSDLLFRRPSERDWPNKTGAVLFARTDLSLPLRPKRIYLSFFFLNGCVIPTDPPVSPSKVHNTNIVNKIWGHWFRKPSRNDLTNGIIMYLLQTRVQTGALFV